MTTSLAEQTAAAVERGRKRLLELQDPGGYWLSGRAADVWLTAAEELFRQFAGTTTEELTGATARWLRSRQRPEGSRADRAADRPGVSASVLGYCALRLAGDSPDAYHMALTAGSIRDAGGLAAADFATRVWLAIFGQASWAELAVPPPEAIFLPAPYQLRAPGHADLGRSATVAVSMIAALRPARRLPFSLAELRLPGTDAAARQEPARVTGFTRIDRSISAYERHADQFAPLGAARSAAVRRCAEWLAGAQRPDGSWPEGDPSQHLCLVALRLAGYAADHPVIARGIARLDAAAVWRPSAAGPQRWLEAGGPSMPVTAQAMCALADAGLPADHEALLSAGEWVLASALAAVAGSAQGRSLAELRVSASNQPGGLTGPGSAEPAAGSRRRHTGGSGGRVADIAAAVLALRRVSLPPRSSQQPATLCLVKWLTETQRGDGGWGRQAAAVAARRSGSVLSAPSPAAWRAASSADLTARALAALAAAGQPGSAVIRRAGTWLLRHQLPGGCWPAGPAAGDLVSTCSALIALVAAGVVAVKAPVTRATGWLLQRQNPDGGWGPGGHDRRAGRNSSEPSSAPHTAQAVLALLAAGNQGSAAAIERGVCWLAGAQLADGSWPDQLPASPDGDCLAGSPAATAWALSALARHQSAPASGPVPGQVARADVVSQAGTDT